MANASDRSDAESSGCQGFTVCLMGHLFDTQAFNECLNACEAHCVNFRIVAWAIGNNVDQDSSVTIQCISADEAALESSRGKIDEICGTNGVRVISASGPEFDHKILKKLNERSQ